jgi:microsomal dipeptidase-like Zn-dependent dipeptidase
MSASRLPVVRRPWVCVLIVAACTVVPAQASVSRYGLANRCFALSAKGGVGGALFFKPTGLGTYLIARRDGRLLAAGGGTTAAPGPDAEWAAQVRRGRLTLRSTKTGEALRVTRLTRGRGCRAYPEAELNARGRPFRGTRRNGGLFGYADAHIHIPASLRAGGQVISGEPYDRFGITEALGKDAEVHGPDGSLDITGNLLKTGNPVGTHDTHGWPTFIGWPRFDTYTHQQIYYRWLQRAWMGGMRLAVAQTVEDEPLCTIEPRKSHSCDETATIDEEIRRLRAMERYVDAQSGGPGRGWFRLVYDPRQARRAIARGKLAVVIGVEASDPFGCSVRLEQPQCDKAAIDRGLAHYLQMGVRAMFIAHWVDNAFAGAALEGGSKGTFIAAMNVAQTGNPFLTAPCPEGTQSRPPDQCNARGLTDLGRYLVGKLIDAHMLIEADHLSEKARLELFDLAAARTYPLLSSHNNTGGFWTPDDLRRLHDLGGYVSATPDQAAALAAKIDDLASHGFTGVGLGTDTGGFAALPAPEAGTRLRYPFRSYDGKVRFSRQRTGTRTFDINSDGVAHYGLMPDLLANVRRAGGGGEALQALFGSAEAYLHTWQRAVAAR